MWPRLAVGVVEPQTERVAGRKQKDILIDVVAVPKFYGRAPLNDPQLGVNFLPNYSITLRCP